MTEKARVRCLPQNSFVGTPSASLARVLQFSRGPYSHDFRTKSSRYRALPVGKTARKDGGQAKDYNQVSHP